MSNTADALADDLKNISQKEDTSNWENKTETNEIVLPFEIREKFRPVLMKYFEMTNKRQGAYVYAEQKTLAYFESMGIPKTAWNYRTRRSG
jgi:uncharacterized protein YdeI (YjbR/CyaY-like superfamily)